jgi:predicted house-cleaning NTP pyrophosphatase (Maf/HAM1 superfamily)/Pyruvate/2-oxoacid:ferredoxin oxidoreductase delta subunit
MILPKILRVLIVDDQVGADVSIQQKFRESLIAIALLMDKESKLEGVEVVFSTTPEDGVKRWQEELFDLSLIDSDFSRNRPPGQAFDLTTHLLSSEYQGFEILRLLIGKDGEFLGRFSHRCNMCHLFLWSGLKEDKLESYQREYEINEKLILSKYPKGRDGKSMFQNILDEMKNIIENILHPSCIEHTVERLLFAVKSGMRNPGGYLLWTPRGKEQIYLEALSARTTDDGNVYLTAHLPSNKIGNVRWLPLQPALLNRIGIVDATRYICLGIENDAITEHCRGLIEQSKRTFEYSNGSSTDINTRPKTVHHLQGGCLYRPRQAIFSKRNDSTLLKPEGDTTFLGFNFKNQYFAAATPLTGMTAVGEKTAIDSMVKKAAALLKGPFGAIVLKTSYLDFVGQWKKVHWPSIQIQSHMRSRCMYPPTGMATLWNTGRTAMEMFPPDMLNALLTKLSLLFEKDEGKYIGTHCIIISLGSKFSIPSSTAGTPIALPALRNIWDTLFKMVFKDLDGLFPLIEINARHFLREIIRDYSTGDEYLARTNDQVLQAFKDWLTLLHRVAVKWKKKLIIKLPHRSDIMDYIRFVADLRYLARREEYGIRALTLVNALKTPVPHTEWDRPYTAGFYSDPDAWEDALDRSGKYQMSGALLAPYRMQLLTPLLDMQEKLGDIEILLTGGIVDHASISSLLENKPIRGVQIGTWGLLSTDIEKKSWITQNEPRQAAIQTNTSDWQVEGCKGKCLSCSVESTGFDFITKVSQQPIQLKKDLQVPLVQLKALGNVCKIRALKLSRPTPNTPKGKQARGISPRFAFLNQKKCHGCGACRQTYYCDAILNRPGTGLPPVLEPRNCSGCGLCAQVCAYEALQLYRPSEVLVLVSASEERHDILSQLGVPFLEIDSQHDIKEFCAFTEPLKEKLIELLTDDGKPDQRLEATNGLKKVLQHIYNQRVENTERPSSDLKQLESIIDALSDEYPNEGDNHLKEAYIQAAIWAMLIWTDPGQVLWESPILTIQTRLHCEWRSDSLSLSELPENEDRVIEFLKHLSGNNLSVISSVVLMHEGMIYCKEIDGPNIALNSIAKESLQAYAASGIGFGRLGGLNIRSSGELLLSNFNELNEDDIFCLSGLPWNAIRKIQLREGKDTLGGRVDKAFAARFSSNYEHYIVA